MSVRSLGTSTAPRLPVSREKERVELGARPSSSDAAALDGFEAGVRSGAPGPRVGLPVPNQFRITSSGLPVAVGTMVRQMRQAGLNLHQSANALRSLVSGGRLPPDFILQLELRMLNRTPLLESQPMARTDYESAIPGISPDKAYAHFVEHPEQVFGAAGLHLRPSVSRLEDGARMFLRDNGPPPAFFPIEVRLEPRAREVRITTLDGHPLRGTNDFRFLSDGRGGTRIHQRSRFQGSSPLIHAGTELFDATERQHRGWARVHAHFFTTLLTGGSR